MENKGKIPTSYSLIIFFLGFASLILNIFGVLYLVIFNLALVSVSMYIKAYYKYKNNIFSWVGFFLSIVNIILSIILIVFSNYTLVV